MQSGVAFGIICGVRRYPARAPSHLFEGVAGDIYFVLDVVKEVSSLVGSCHAATSCDDGLESAFGACLPSFRPFSPHDLPPLAKNRRHELLVPLCLCLCRAVRKEGVDEKEGELDRSDKAVADTDEDDGEEGLDDHGDNVSVERRQENVQVPENFRENLAEFAGRRRQNCAVLRRARRVVREYL